jgi:GNAT superfamily N-acetyltransferase
MSADAGNMPAGLRLTVGEERAPEDIRFLESGLSAFNVEQTGINDGKWFSIFLRRTDGVPGGGAFGWSWGGTCYIRYLYLAADLRRQRLGTLLMQAVEREALARGCRQILLETYSFQAPGFYRKLGFEQIGDTPDYPQGHRYLTMLKRLA